MPQLPPIRVSGLNLTAGNKLFRFIGANTANFGYYREYGLSIEEAVKAAKANGITVLRIYLGFGRDTWGGKPFEEYDKVLDIAARNDVYIIATLTDGCCFGGDPSQTSDEYFARFPYLNMTSESSLAAFEEYIESVLLRKNTVNGKLYRDDPTILAWDVANEPALQLFSHSEFNVWLGKVTTYIKSLDPNHLITIGVNTGVDVYNSPGSHYEALNVSGLDFYSIHHNLPNYQAVASNLDSIRYRIEMFRAMGKPVVLEEFGVGSERIFPQGVDNNKLNAWLQAYQDQLDTAFSAGASGAMFWGWGVPETKTVPLWWRLEDHDRSETEFTTLIRDYQMPPATVATGSVELINTPQPTLALPQPVYVKAFCTLIGEDKQRYVAPNTPVVILWGWGAKTEAQIKDFFNNHLTTVTLDGNDISTGAPYSFSGNNPDFREVVWFAEVGPLSPGLHTILYDVSWKAMISDGTDTYGPGGKFETEHDECEIIVQ